MKWGEVEQAGLFPTKEVISVRLAAPCFIWFGTGHPHQGRAAFPTPGSHMPRLAGFNYGTRPTAEHSHLLPPIPHAGRKQLPPWETVVMMLGAERAVLVSPTNRFPHAKVCRVQMRNPAYGCSFSLKLCQVDDVGVDDATSLCFIDLVFSIFHDDLTVRVKEFVLLDHQAIV